MRLGSPAFLPFSVYDRRRSIITVVSSSFGDSASGGIARFLTDLVPQFVRLGHEVRAVTKSTAHPTVDLEDGAWVHRVTPTAGDGALPGTSPAIDGFAAAALAEVERIRQYRPIGVVYGPVWDMEILPIIRMTDLATAVHLATPVAVTNNLDGDIEYSPDAYASLLLALEHETFETADLLHANSHAVIDTIAQRYPRPLDPRRVAVAALGSVDRNPPPVERADDVHDTATVEILFVGRLEPRKGIDTLLAAIELVAPDVPQLHGVIAGADNPGEADIRGPWQRRVATDPWSRRIEFAGKVSDAELEALYARADIVALPSRYESFGLTIVEAMRHGAAIVSTTAGAIPELIANGVEGLLVPPGDPESLGNAIRLLVEDPQTRRRMGRAGRARFVRDFTIESAAERLLAGLARVHRVEMVGGPGGIRSCPIASGSVVRLAVRAPDGGTIRVNGTDVAICPAGTDRRRIERVQLSPSSCETVQVEVIDGDVDVLSAIVVSGP
jgi:glycosyltransferase involved in cell wall biosynthesis